MGLADWLFGATPGQQAGQLAEKAIGSVFDGVKGIIEEFHMSPEDKAKLQLALLQQQVQATQQLLDDVKSARQMQMATQSRWPGILSTVIILGFFGGGGYILVHGVNSSADELSKQIINMFAVQLMAGVSAVWGFWLGSSHGSQSKDQLLYQATPKKDAP